MGSDNLLLKQNTDWVYRIERNISPLGVWSNGWKVTAYPHTLHYPIKDFYMENLPDWLNNIVCLLDTAGVQYAVSGIGKKLNDTLYWVRNDDEEK